MWCGTLCIWSELWNVEMGEKKKRLRWFGHTEKMKGEDFVRKMWIQTVDVAICPFGTTFSHFPLTENIKMCGKLYPFFADFLLFKTTITIDNINTINTAPPPSQTSTFYFYHRNDYLKSLQLLLLLPWAWKPLRSPVWFKWCITYSLTNFTHNMSLLPLDILSQVLMSSVLPPAQTWHTKISRTQYGSDLSFQ